MGYEANMADPLNAILHSPLLQPLFLCLVICLVDPISWLDFNGYLKLRLPSVPYFLRALLSETSDQYVLASWIYSSFPLSDSSSAIHPRILDLLSRLSQYCPLVAGGCVLPCHASLSSVEDLSSFVPALPTVPVSLELTQSLHCGWSSLFK